MITNSGHVFYRVVNGAVKWDDIAHLRDNLPDEITLNHMDDHGLLALQGPKAVDALARMGLTPLQPGWTAVSELVFMPVRPYEWNGVPVSARRSGYTGEDGFEISLPGEALTAFAAETCAMAAVKPNGRGTRALR